MLERMGNRVNRGILRGVAPILLRRVSFPKPEPKMALGSILLGCSIAIMKKLSAPRSRRRLGQPLGHKILVYLTQEERLTIDQAAAAERRSVSSFIANAAVEAAERVIG